MKFNPDHEHTIVSGELINADGETLGHFSSHTAAWEALCSLRDVEWKPTWGPSQMTPDDLAIVAGLRA